MSDRICAVAGVGPGNGTALSRKFSERGYRVAMLARSEDRLDRLEKEIPGAKGYPVDIGNTSAWRGSANFAAFAPTKAAQRILAQSMARSLGPQGIHVAYIVVDAVIDVPWTRKMNPKRPDEFFIQPSDIAESVFHLSQQNPSAWTFEMDLRPFGEKW